MAMVVLLKLLVLGAAVVSASVVRRGMLKEYVTHSGTYCFDMRTILKNKAREAMWETLRQNTAQYVQIEAAKVCGGGGGISVMATPGSLTGGIGMGKGCAEQWRKTYKREPSQWFLNLTTDCLEQNYNCKEKKDPLTGVTKSGGHMDFSCRYAIEFFNPGNTEQPEQPSQCLPFEDGKLQYGNAVFQISNGRGCWWPNHPALPQQLPNSFSWGGCFNGVCSGTSTPTFFRCQGEPAIYAWPRAKGKFQSCWVDTPVKYQTYGSPPVFDLTPWHCSVMKITGQGAVGEPLVVCPWPQGWPLAKAADPNPAVQFLAGEIKNATEAVNSTEVVSNSILP